MWLGTVCCWPELRKSWDLADLRRRGVQQDHSILAGCRDRLESEAMLLRELLGRSDRRVVELEVLVVHLPIQWEWIRMSWCGSRRFGARTLRLLPEVRSSCGTVILSTISVRRLHLRLLRRRQWILRVSSRRLGRSAPRSVVLGLSWFLRPTMCSMRRWRSSELFRGGGSLMAEFVGFFVSHSLPKVGVLLSGMV